MPSLICRVILGGISIKIGHEALAANWRCPVCGAQKKRFANVGPAGTPSGFKENLDFGLGVNRLTPGQKSILMGALIIMRGIHAKDV